MESRRERASQKNLTVETFDEEEAANSMSGKRLNKASTGDDSDPRNPLQRAPMKDPPYSAPAAYLGHMSIPYTPTPVAASAPSQYNKQSRLQKNGSKDALNNSSSLSSGFNLSSSHVDEKPMSNSSKSQSHSGTDWATLKYAPNPAEAVYGSTAGYGNQQYGNSSCSKSGATSAPSGASPYYGNNTYGQEVSLSDINGYGGYDRGYVTPSGPPQDFVRLVHGIPKKLTPIPSGPSSVSSPTGRRDADLESKDTETEDSGLRGSPSFENGGTSSSSTWNTEAPGVVVSTVSTANVGTDVILSGAEGKLSSPSSWSNFVSNVIPTGIKNALGVDNNNRDDLVIRDSAAYRREGSTDSYFDAQESQAEKSISPQSPYSNSYGSAPPGYDGYGGGGYMHSGYNNTGDSGGRSSPNQVWNRSPSTSRGERRGKSYPGTPSSNVGASLGAANPENSYGRQMSSESDEFMPSNLILARRFLSEFYGLNDQGEPFGSSSSSNPQDETREQARRLFESQYMIEDLTGFFHEIQAINIQHLYMSTPGANRATLAKFQETVMRNMVLNRFGMPSMPQQPQQQTMPGYLGDGVPNQTTTGSQIVGPPTAKSIQTPRSTRDSTVGKMFHTKPSTETVDETASLAQSRTFNETGDWVWPVYAKQSLLDAKMAGQPMPKFPITIKEQDSPLPTAASTEHAPGQNQDKMIHKNMQMGMDQQMVWDPFFANQMMPYYGAGLMAPPFSPLTSPLIKGNVMDMPMSAGMGMPPAMNDMMQGGYDQGMYNTRGIGSQGMDNNQSGPIQNYSQGGNPSYSQGGHGVNQGMSAGRTTSGAQIILLNHLIPDTRKRYGPSNEIDIHPDMDFDPEEMLVVPNKKKKKKKKKKKRSTVSAGAAEDDDGDEDEDDDGATNRDSVNRNSTTSVDGNSRNGGSQNNGSKASRTSQVNNPNNRNWSSSGSQNNPNYWQSNMSRANNSYQ